MKILMLTPYLPYPPSSGGQVRSYNLIKNLASKHKITLFSLIKDEGERKYAQELEKYCQKIRIFKRPAKPWTLKNILRTVLGFYPFLVVRNLSSGEKKAVKKELAREKYDLIHAENFYVMPHIPKTPIPILLTEQTILYRVYQHLVESLSWYLFWLKPILMIDVLKLRYWESFYWKTADFLSAVSKEDRLHIESLISRKQISIIPNGVDFKYFNQKKYKKYKRPTVLFGAADFHWMQNKEGVNILLSHIWPRIKQKIPKAKLWIVGKIAPEVLSDYLGQKDVLIEEIDDNRRAYQQAWALVAPMRSGGGSRTKFFEAMASGLPIVTTPEGIEGISAKNGQGVLIENNLAHLAETAIKLLLDPKKARKIGLKGKKLVKEKYDWSKSADTLNKLYQKIGHEKN